MSQLYDTLRTFTDDDFDLAAAAWLAASGLIGWKTALGNTLEVSAEGWTPAGDGFGNMFVNELCAICSPVQTHKPANIN